jgi:hypothetical protein
MDRVRTVPGHLERGRERIVGGGVLALLPCPAVDVVLGPSDARGVRVPGVRQEFKATSELWPTEVSLREFNS